MCLCAIKYRLLIGLLLFAVLFSADQFALLLIRTFKFILSQDHIYSIIVFVSLHYLITFCATVAETNKRPIHLADPILVSIQRDLLHALKKQFLPEVYDRQIIEYLLPSRCFPRVKKQGKKLTKRGKENVFVFLLLSRRHFI